MPDDRLLQGFQPVWVPGPRSGTGRWPVSPPASTQRPEGPFPGGPVANCTFHSTDAVIFGTGPVHQTFCAAWPGLGGVL